VLERFVPLGRGKQLKEEVLSAEEWQKVVETVLKLAGVNYSLDEVLSFKAFQFRFKGGEIKLAGANCNLGEDVFCLMPSGDLYPCRRLPLKLGNLLESSLEEIIEKSTFLKKIKDKRQLKGKCFLCPVEDCIGCRALAYALTGDYLAEDTQCWF
jgi:radical SAM protein with 4Fe4S-binding SPASM domain